ncbi:MAG TPA: zinc-dependent metalloprotease [Acidimicrobiales bacterium]|jgi:putative hydrolase|nr:zinc-dependent metalloprotease [Acidimicrobiales bacterium]
MAPPEPGDAGNPFQSLLGDLMNMLGTNAPNQWEMTRSFALNVATGGSAEANVDPTQRIRLEQLARVAELNVIETTGMPVTPDGRRLTCVPVGRGDWTLRALESWRTLLTSMAPAPGPMPPEPPAGDATPVDPFGEDDPMAGLGGLLGQWATAIGPMFFGLQVGSVVGHLSQRALGQYPLAVPWAPSEELVLVTENIASFAADWSLPEEEALLWICARELASNSVLTRPGIRARLEELLTALAESSAAATQDLTGRLGALGSPGGPDATGMDLESLQGMFGDPEALLGELLTPESRRSSDQLTSLAVVVDAYADHVATVVGQKLVGSHTQLAEAWYRRRIERGKGEEAAGALFGLDLDQTQVDRGRSFVSGVLERAGDDGLARLWISARNLPTPSEVDAPGLWLERISLPELDEPQPD